MDNIFKEYVLRTLNISEEQVTALKDGDKFKPDALDTLLGMDKTRTGSMVSDYEKQLDALKAKSKEDRENQLKRGIKEGASKYEAILSKAGIKVTENESELLEQLTSNKGKVDLDVTATKEYLDLQESLNKTKSEYEEKLKGVQSNFEREKGMWRYIQKASGVIDGLNPVSKPPAVVDIFNKTLMQYTVEDQDNRTIVKDSEGKVLRNEQNNPITWEQHVERTAVDYFAFAKQGDKQGTGNEAGQRGPLNNSKLSEDDKAVKLKELQTRARNARSPEEKDAIKKEAEALLA